MVEDTDPGLDDLTANRPGQSARLKAIELKQSAPFATLVARVLRVKTDERAFRVGADGEEEVARRLSRLGDAWHVVHAVPVGNRGSDIDHVVVGPPGVLTLNTKNHLGGNVWVSEHRVMVNGQKTHYLRNSRFEAERASRLISAACGFDMPVQPVLVVMADRLTIKGMPSGVHVVGRKMIAKWLKARPETLTPGLVEEVFSHVRRQTTWVSSSGRGG